MTSTSDSDPSPLLGLSPELKDVIASNLREYSDLLSTALTHSSFRDVIIPHHLHYPSICCGPNSIDCFDHLLENRRRADNVQVLRILNLTWQQKGAPWFNPAAYSYQSRNYILPKAIASFPNLRSFKLVEDHMQGFSDHRDDRETAIWEKLQSSCPHLEGMDIDGLFACPSCPRVVGDSRRIPSMASSFCGCQSC